jgi:hypothetical protein
MPGESKTNFKRIYIVIGAVIVFLILLVIFKSPTTNNPAAPDTLASKSLVSKVTSVSSSILSQIGLGTSTPKPTAISGKIIATSDGLPKILYIGAEYCPYCATERWPMAVALSRFGTFSNLQITHSSSTDVYPDTQTFSFHGSTFTSNYIGFEPVEEYTNIASGSGYTKLDTPNTEDSSLMTTYDAPPYVPSSDQGAIPFIYFAGKYLVVGATYSPALLQNLTADQIASALNNPSSAIAKGVDGAANGLTAAICEVTNNLPTSACTSTIKSIESKL